MPTTRHHGTGMVGAPQEVADGSGRTGEPGLDGHLAVGDDIAGREPLEDSRSRQSRSPPAASERAEQPIAHVAETGGDVGGIVEATVEGGGHDPHVGVLVVHGLHARRGGDHAQGGDRSWRRSALALSTAQESDPPVASIGSRISTWADAEVGGLEVVLDRLDGLLVALTRRRSPP